MAAPFKSQSRVDTLPADARRRIESLDRTVFADELIRVMGKRPSEANLQKWANRYPDRWIVALCNLARLNGYTDRSESVALHLHANVTAMSDAELEIELSRATALLSLASSNPNAITLDAKPSNVQPTEQCSVDGKSVT
jgi:hypothetical protein